MRSVLELEETESGCRMGDGADSPLWLDGWLRWNEEMWGLKAERVSYSPEGKDLPRLEGVLYLDHRGRVYLPPRNPYLPFSLATSGTIKPDRVYRQYTETMALFAADLARRGLGGPIALPPGLTDARPFQWCGFTVSPRYTFLQPFPLERTFWTDSVEKNIKKAQKLGYSVKRSEDWRLICYCLRATEQAKSFSHHTNENELARCYELLGAEHMVGYLAFDASGEPVSGGIRLVMQGGTELDWSQGAVRSHLNSGINQLLYSFVLEDAVAMGAIRFDWGGANAPPVALAKSAWGAPLVPYMQIEQPRIGSFVRSAAALALRSGLARLGRR